MYNKVKPHFHPGIFWDVDIAKLDFDVNVKFIIERVFERGDVEDIRQCRKYYGDEEVTATLLDAKYLPERRLYLSSAVTGQPLNKFKCYILRQSNQELYPY